MLKASMFNISVSDNVIYNAYTGAIVKLLQPLRDYIASGENMDLLRAQGFVVDERINELNHFLLERNTNIFSRWKRDLKYVIAVTNDCQAHCAYCFEHGIDRHCYMSEDTANKVLAYIKNQAEQNQAAGIQITYFGGEPLLNLKIIEKIGADLKQYCALHQIRFTANIVTNAIALTKEAAERLAEIGVNFAQITLDGTKNAYKAAKGLDAYDLVLEHIKSARSIFPVDIRLNITRENTADIAELVDELFTVHGLAGRVQLTLAQVVDYVGCSFNSELCLDGVEYARFVRDVFLEKEAAGQGSLKRKQLLPKIRRMFCGMENCMQYVIGPEGELYKCEHSVGKAEEIVGDLDTGTYSSDLEMQFYAPVPQKCIEAACPFLPMCLGGCANERLHTGHPCDCAQEKEKQLQLLSTYLELLHS